MFHWRSYLLACVRAYLQESSEIRQERLSNTKAHVIKKGARYICKQTAPAASFFLGNFKNFVLFHYARAFIGVTFAACSLHLWIGKWNHNLGYVQRSPLISDDVTETSKRGIGRKVLQTNALFAWTTSELPWPRCMYDAVRWYKKNKKKRTSDRFVLHEIKVA